MGRKTGNPRGRPPKPEEEKAVKRLISFPPELWSRLEAAVPVGERSAFIQRAIARELEKAPSEDRASS